MRYSALVLQICGDIGRDRARGPRIATLLCAVLALASCSSGDPACVESPSADCQPLYQPTYEEVFNRTIVPRCAVSGGACHSGSDAKGGLRMDDIDETYAQLVGEGRVIPSDASCSLMVIRIEGEGGLMPPGAKLSDAERCAVATWVANGAER